MMASGSISAARERPSARTSRPSASVFSTSIVCPSRMVSTSPGFVARPPGMFSVTGVTPVTFTLTPRSPQADSVAITAAAPLISVFIVSIPPAVFSERPPESNVMPLPAKTTWGTRPSISTGSDGS